MLWVEVFIVLIIAGNITISSEFFFRKTIFPVVVFAEIFGLFSQGDKNLMERKTDFLKNRSLAVLLKYMARTRNA